MTFLDTEELAERWRTSRGYLANRRCAGKGPEYIKVGSKVLYPIDKVESYELEKRGADASDLRETE